MSQVVIIAGMHRSGTSMIARLLNLCGIYLGAQSDLLLAQPDNPAGYWENRRFLQLNEVILSELKADWDCPPNIGSGWEKSKRFSPIRVQAQELIDSLSVHQHWGWKDPRNSLTLPFWTELLPSSKVVICVRNPLEVANSLFQRNHHSHTLAHKLWLEYNQRILLDSKPENRIVTHYEAYFRDPLTELSRIVKFLQIEIPEEQLKHCLETVNIRLRHNQSTFEDLALDAPDNVLDLYQKICDQSPKEIFSRKSAAIFENTPDPEKTELRIRSLSIRLEIVKKLLKEKEQEIQTLTTQLHEREHDLAEIYRSKAWHFVQTVRRTRQKLLG